MKTAAIAVASLLAISPALTNLASAAQPNAGTWSFTDYTPDPTVLAAAQTFHVATGKTDASYCHGGRVPSAPQDLNSHRLTVSAPATLRLTATTSGVWGFEVDGSRGNTLVGAATVRSVTSAVHLKLRVRPGTYVVSSCNLGGAPTAQVSYRLTPTR